jgi:hypothetical protein
MSVGNYRIPLWIDIAQSLVIAKFLLMRLLLSVALCAGMAVCALAHNSQQSASDESWTATTDISLANGNPARTTESHTKCGNRTLDKKKIEVLGINGRYEPFSESETETVQIDVMTIRTVVRNYNWDGNGRRKLAQLTEEESRTTASGETRTERKTSNSDLNGNFQVVQREIVSTRKISPDVEETKSAVYRADSYGGLSQVLETNELKTHNADGSVAVKRTNRIPDGNGSWKVSDETKTTITDDGKNRTTDERFSATDLEGRLYETSRKVSKEGETATGEKKRTEEIYSHVSAAGYFDSSMHLNERVTTIQRKDADGETSEEQIEQPSAGNPSDGPKIVARAKSVVQHAAAGMESKKTAEARDVNGRFNATSVETRQSTQAPAVQDSSSRHLQQRDTPVRQKDPDETSVEQIEQPGVVNSSDRPKVTARTKYVVQYAANRTESKRTAEARDGKIKPVEEQIEQPGVVNSSDRPKVTPRTKYVVQYAASGTESKKSVEARDANNFNIISIESRKSTQAPPAQNSPALLNKP